ncbi:MAG: transcriptional repressor [Deltaproteobacteria bacterium]|nr:transcriptional repressor [Deltaproteobacteria bacterium]
MKLKFNFKNGKTMEPNQFKTLISKEGLKSTRQRAEILDIFLNSTGHKNLAEIYAQVARMNPKIGYTTVYRTLKLLTRLGLAAKRKFADGETRYEPTSEGSHHDHLICLRCGEIVEFEDEVLEAHQNRIARRHGFNIFHHRMELYGYCGQCARKKTPSRRKG